MMQKVLKINFIIIFILLMFTGCWDFQDVNEKSFIVSVAVDRIDGQIEIIGEAIAFGSSSMKQSKGEESKNEFFIYSGKGSDFEEARLEIDAQASYTFYLGGARSVIFGENLAKSGIEEYLNRIDGTRDYRKTVILFVSKDPPSELFKLKLENDVGVGFFLENSIEGLEQLGKGFYYPLSEILQNQRMGQAGYVLPYIVKKEEKVLIDGFAVMQNSKMIDKITTDDIYDLKGLIYLMGKKPSIVQNIQLQDNEYIFDTQLVNRKIKTNYIKDQVQIDIKLKVKAQLLYAYKLQYISDELIGEMEELLVQRIENEIKGSIERNQKNKVDIFNFIKYLRAQHPQVYKEIKWDEAFPNAKINLNTEVSIINNNMKDLKK